MSKISDAQKAYQEIAKLQQVISSSARLDIYAEDGK